MEQGLIFDVALPMPEAGDFGAPGAGNTDDLVTSFEERLRATGGNISKADKKVFFY